MGDFNLDYNKLYDVNYVHKNLFLDFDEILYKENLNFSSQCTRCNSWGQSYTKC